jgi:hypothetical protein
MAKCSFETMGTNDPEMMCHIPQDWYLNKKHKFQHSYNYELTMVSNRPE